jgi:hypothetical protein
MVEMKKCMPIVVIGCLFLMTASGQAQMDKMMDRFFQRGEPDIRPSDLRVLDLEVTPDPIREGQRVRFRVTIANSSGHTGRISLTIRDRDEIVSQVRDIHIYPRENRIDFPEMDYRFSRSDYCFTVEADIGQTRHRIDVAKEFCARRTPSGWTLSDRGMGRLWVEDLDMYPDPATPGQEVRFRVRLRNDGRPIRGTIRIQDKDQVVVQGGNITISPGLSDVQFPSTRFPFQRFDHCFTVLVDVERTPYPVDAAREFCAKPMGWTLRP